MATVTPNFNWPVPTSTDLVKDGATAIEALGDSIDASLVDLKGGTTGQVLSKTSNTDMDFTWVAADDTNAIQNTIVDAKGDLIAASAADTPARLAVGTNGFHLAADSTAATGLKWESPTGPAFIGYSSTSQTLTANTFTKIIINNEIVDTDNCFDPVTNYRFTPTKAGLYQISASVQLTDYPLRGLVSLYVNGGEYARFSDVTNGATVVDFGGSGSILVKLNGTTDYVELYTFSTGTPSTYVAGGTVKLSATWIRS
jgi:hypothetical protein